MNNIGKSMIDVSYNKRGEFVITKGKKILELDTTVLNINGKDIDIQKTKLLFKEDFWTRSKEEINKTLMYLKPVIDLKDQFGYSPLMWACANGYIEVAKTLIDAKANIDLKNSGGSSLYLAFENDKLDVAKFLIKSKANVNLRANYGTGNSMLIQACKRNNFNMAKMLIDAKANINAQDNDGNTALIIAAKKGNIEITSLLIENKKICVNIRNKNKELAISYSSANGNVDTTKLLIEAKSELNLKNNLGNIPLLLAAINSDVYMKDANKRKNYIEVIDLLIEAGSDIYTSNEEGTTLHKNLIRNKILKKITKNVIHNSGAITTVFPFPTTGGGHIKLFELITEYAN